MLLLCCGIVVSGEMSCLTYTLMASPKTHEYSLNLLIASSASVLCSRVIIHLGMLHKLDKLLRRYAWLAMLDMAGQRGRTLGRILGIILLVKWSSMRL